MGDGGASSAPRREERGGEREVRILGLGLRRLSQYPRFSPSLVLSLGFVRVCRDPAITQTLSVGTHWSHGRRRTIDEGRGELGLG